MCDMRFWRVGIARNAVFFHSLAASLAGKDGHFTSRLVFFFGFRGVSGWGGGVG